MGIYIKGERIPTDCEDCKMADCLEGDECPFYVINKGDYPDRRYERCPLVEIPEHHGRLIDEDNIKYKHEEVRTIDDGWKWDELLTVTREEISKLPTVIEAEK